MGGESTGSSTTKAGAVAALVAADIGRAGGMPEGGGLAAAGAGAVRDLLSWDVKPPRSPHRAGLRPRTAALVRLLTITTAPGAEEGAADVRQKRSGFRRHLWDVSEGGAL